MSVSSAVRFGPLHQNPSPVGFLTFQSVLELELVIDLSRPAGLSALWPVLPCLSFLLWNKTALFLVGHLPENSLRYWVSLPLSSKKKKAHMNMFLSFPFCHPSSFSSCSCNRIVGVYITAERGSGSFLTVMQGTLVYLTLWVTVQLSREWMSSFLGFKLKGSSSLEL